MRTFSLILVLMLGIVSMESGASAAASVPHSVSREKSSPAPGAVEINAAAPGFRLDGVVNNDFKKIGLSDYSGKWVVLFFYPGDFTFVCPTEIRGFNTALDEFAKINAQVLAVSADSKFSHLAWIKSGVLGKVEFPILSDFSKRTARAYGVLDEEGGQARRGLFIIDPGGLIQYQVVHSDRVGRSVEETLRVLKALQTEELCPINWKPGEKTIRK